MIDSDQKTRILFIVDRLYRPDAHGGIESSTHDLCLALSSSGVATAVLSRLKPEGKIYLQNRIESIVTRRRAPFDRIGPYKVYRSWSLPDAMEEVVSRFQPSVAVFNQVGNFVTLANMSAKIGVRPVIYFRDNEWSPNEDDVQQLAGMAIIANSSFTAQRLSDKYGFEAAVIPPIVLPKHCKAAATGDAVTLIGVSVKKGVLRAIELARRLPNTPFLFVRSWNRPDPNIIRQIEALPNVSFMQPTLDVRKIFAKTRVLLVPSTCDEAWGRVVTEAQLNGIPVIASEKGGLPESVGDGGLILPLALDINEWAAAIARLYSDEAWYTTLSKKAQLRVEKEDVTPRILVRKFQDVCSSVAN